MLSKVAIVGQGYVGLPVALAACNSGFEVVGIDINVEKVRNLNLGISGIEGIDDINLSKLVKLGSYLATNEFKAVSTCEVVVICVPTPLDYDNKPDMSALDLAVTSISRYLKKGTLVILESTVQPGFTRNYLVSKVENESGIHRDDLYVAFSPERIDPLNKVWTITNTPKIVSGLTKEALEKTVNFYSKFVDKVITVESLEIAETSKLLENSFRLINISFINELSLFCYKLGLSIDRVIEAAATKPYGFMPFYPGLGVGGHCIPVDPIYLLHKAKEVGAHLNLIEIAAKVNNQMADSFVSRAENMIGDLSGKRILILGVSYKPNLADTRETPSQKLIEALVARGAIVNWHDEIVKVWNNSHSVQLSTEYDLAIIATLHDHMNLDRLGNVPIINTRDSV
jgi:UDP-N-acetyl-D-glucosamine dehydrogenase